MSPNEREKRMRPATGDEWERAGEADGEADGGADGEARIEYWVPCGDDNFVPATDEDMRWIRAYERELALAAKHAQAADPRRQRPPIFRLISPIFRAITTRTRRVRSLLARGSNTTSYVR